MLLTESDTVCNYHKSPQYPSLCKDMINHTQILMLSQIEEYFLTCQVFLCYSTGFFYKANEPFHNKSRHAICPMHRPILHFLIACKSDKIIDHEIFALSTLKN